MTRTPYALKMRTACQETPDRLRAHAPRRAGVATPDGSMSRLRPPRRRSAHLPRSGNRLAIEWPLKGLLRCAACGRGMSPHTVRKGPRVYRYYRCRSTAGGQPPCGNQVAAYAIETAVQRKLSKKTGANVGLNEIGNHVESLKLKYDAGTGTVSASLIVTETTTADSERFRNPVDCSSREERPTPTPSRRSRRPAD